MSFLYKIYDFLNFQMMSVTMLLCTLILLCLILVKDGSYRTIVASESKGIVFSFFTFLLSSWVFRIFLLKNKITTEIFTYALLSDLYCYLQLLVFCTLYIIFNLSFNYRKALQKSHNMNYVSNYYLYISLLYLVFQGILWGFYTAFGRYVSLELFYLIDILDIKDLLPAFFITMFLGVSYFVYFNRFYRNIENISKKRTTVFLSFCIILSAISYSFNKLPVYEHFLLINEKATIGKNITYAQDYKISLIKKSGRNPVFNFFAVVPAEFIRIIQFNLNKKVSPFFKRPKTIPQWEISNVSYLLDENEKIIDPNFPAYRYRSSSKKHDKKYNVVIIVLESFDAPSSSVFKNFPCPYSCLRELMDSSVVFTNAFANAQASYEGQSSVASGLPVWGVVSGELFALHGLIPTKSYLKLMKENDYNSYFVTSWEPKKQLAKARYRKILDFFNLQNIPIHSESDNYTSPFLIAGIERISGLFDENLSFSDLDKNIHAYDNEFAEKYHYKHGVYYIHDEYTYKKLYGALIKTKQPSFLVTHTFTSHTEFPLPNGAVDRPVDANMENGERFFLCVKYAANQLKAFFDKVKNDPIYKDTIFIICADHTSRTADNLYDEYHIPLIIHAPHLLKPRVIDTPVSQMDIGVTIMGLLDLEGTYTTYGTNMLREDLPKQRGILMPDWNGSLVYAIGDYIAKLDVDKVYELYDYKHDKYYNLINDKEKNSEIIEYVHKKFLLDYSIFGDTIYGNKIMPQDAK